MCQTPTMAKILKRHRTILPAHALQLRRTIDHHERLRHTLLNRECVRRLVAADALLALAQISPTCMVSQ